MGKFKVKKASLGLQSVAVPNEMSGAQQLGGIAAMTGQAAQIGSNFGPYGTAIGAGVGLIGGTILTEVQKRKMQEAHDNAVAENQRIAMDNLRLGGREQTQIKPTLFATGTPSLKQENKLIEVERKELIFEKNDEGKFYLVADFSNGKTHREGGEPYVAKRGQVIFPADMYDEVSQAWKDRNHAKLERMRLSLPKDKQPTEQYYAQTESMGMENPEASYVPVDKAKKGKRFVLPKYQTGASNIGDPEDPYLQWLQTLPRHKQLSRDKDFNPSHWEYFRKQDLSSPDYLNWLNQRNTQTPPTPIQNRPRTLGYNTTSPNVNQPSMEYPVTRTSNNAALDPNTGRWRGSGSGSYSNPNIIPQRPSGGFIPQSPPRPQMPSRNLPFVMGDVPVPDVNLDSNEPLQLNLPNAGLSPDVVQPDMNLGNLQSSIPSVESMGGVPQTRRSFNFQMPNINQNQILGGVGQVANLYNTARGFMEQPQVNQPIVPRLEQMDFRDRYNPQRRNVLENQRLVNQQLSQGMGGNSSVLAANQAIANARATGQLNDINNQAANEAYNVDTTNLQLRNQWEQNAANEYRRIQDINDQNKAAQTRFQTAAVTGIGQNAYDQIAYNQAQSRDQRMEEVQKEYIKQMAMRDSVSAKVMLTSRPDALQYWTNQEIMQIFGSQPELAQEIIAMKNAQNRPRFQTVQPMNSPQFTPSMTLNNFSQYGY